MCRCDAARVAGSDVVYMVEDGGRVGKEEEEKTMPQ